MIINDRRHHWIVDIFALNKIVNNESLNNLLIISLLMNRTVHYSAISSEYCTNIVVLYLHFHLISYLRSVALFFILQHFMNLLTNHLAFHIWWYESLNVAYSLYCTIKVMWHLYWFPLNLIFPAHFFFSFLRAVKSRKMTIDWWSRRQPGACSLCLCFFLFFSEWIMSHFCCYTVVTLRRKQSNICVYTLFPPYQLHR